MTKQDIYNTILHHIEGVNVVLSENLTFAYLPDKPTQVQYCRGSVVLEHLNGQAFKYQIEYYHQPELVKKFTIRCVGEVVTPHYTPPEDEM